MKREFYVTESGVVVERCGPIDTSEMRAPFRHVATGSKHGVLRLSNLRLATPREVAEAQKRRDQRALDERTRRRGDR